MSRRISVPCSFAGVPFLTGNGLVGKHDGYAVPDGVDDIAGPADEALRGVTGQGEFAVTDRARKNVQQFLKIHGLFLSTAGVSAG